MRDPCSAATIRLPCSPVLHATKPFYYNEEGNVDTELVWAKSKLLSLYLELVFASGK